MRMFMALNRLCLFYLTPVCAVGYLFRQGGLPPVADVVVAALVVPGAVAVFKLNRRGT